MSTYPCFIRQYCFFFGLVTQTAPKSSTLLDLSLYYYIVEIDSEQIIKIIYYDFMPSVPPI